MPDQPDASYKYYLVQFTEPMTKTLKDIEILPLSWIDVEDKKLMAFYPSPPYTVDLCKKIQSMISKSEDIDPSWDTYEVLLKGRAKTLQEAKKKLTLLKRQETALTSDGEGLSQRVESELLKSLKTRQEQKKKFDKSNLEIFDEDEDDYDANSSQDEAYEPEFDSSASSVASPELAPAKSTLKSRKSEIVKIPPPKTPQSVIYPQHITPSKTTKGLPKVVQIQNINSKTLQKSGNLMQPSSISTPMNKATTKPGSKSPEREYEKQFSRSTSDMKNRKLNPELQKFADYMLPKIDQLFQMRTQPLVQKVNGIATKLDSVCLEQESKKYDVVNAATFKNKYEIQLPIHTLEEFDQFDEKLLDKEAAQDLENSMVSSFDPNITISRNISTILKICIKKEVAVNFTALKKTGCKRVLANTNFYKVLEAFLLMAYKAAKQDTKQSTIQKALSEVMANTVDWEGGRKNRKSVKSKELNKEDEKEI